MVEEDEEVNRVENIVQPVKLSCSQSYFIDRHKRLLCAGASSSASASTPPPTVRVGYNGLGGRETYASPCNGPFSTLYSSQ